MSDIDEYFREFYTEQLPESEENYWIVRDLYEKLEDGDLHVLKILEKHSYDEYVTMCWLRSLNKPEITLEHIKSGISYLVSKEKFKFEPGGYLLETPGSRQHIMLMYLIQNRLITEGQVNVIFLQNEKDEDDPMWRMMTLRKNIPRAAANRVARQVLEQRIPIHHPGGPLNLIRNYAGNAPAYVRRPRKTRRRNYS